MKITTTKTVTGQMEISLPYFFKSGTDYCAIYNDGAMFTVTFREYTSLPPSVWITSHGVDVPANHEEITRKQFEEIFDKANDYIAEQYEEMRDVMRERNEIYVPNYGEGEE